MGQNEYINRRSNVYSRIAFQAIGVHRFLLYYVPLAAVYTAVQEVQRMISVEQVLSDMSGDDGIVSRAARDYYRVHYATAEQRARMDREDRWALIGVYALLLCAVAACVFAVVGGIK
jgi:hypothetical protein